MDNPQENTNNLSNLKSPRVFYSVIAMIIFLIIMMSLVFLKVSVASLPANVKSQNEAIINTSIILIFSLIVFLLCLILIPSFKEFKSLFQQISSVTYVLLYTIFLILFMTLMPSEILNSYAIYITPITILLGLFSFYKGIKTDYVEKFNINYERIKTIIMIFCLITCYIVYYNIDPGGFISKSFGYTLLLTIIIAVFAFLYLIILLTLNNGTPSSDSNVKKNSLFENFSKFSVYGSISFIIFLIIVTIVISTYPGGFFTDKIIAGSALTIILLICILWSTLLACSLFPEISNANKRNTSDSTNFFKRALLMLFGIVISGLIIFWLVYNIQNLSSDSSIVSFVLNLLLVIILLGLIYKTINVNLPVGNSKKNGFFNIIINLIFYIPCVFSNLFDFIGKLAVGEINSNTAGSLIMLVIAILLITAYFSLPTLFNKFSLQGGKQLVNKPVYTDTQYTLGTYEELGNSTDASGNYLPKYQYAISCWVFIDAAAPNTNASYEKYTSLLNFGNKPNILYNGSTNTLMITMEQKDLAKNTKNKFTEFDDNGNRIMYKSGNILLQKWNNIIINYNGGVLDVFLNGELVKSDACVVPYYTIDSLTIGENNGLKGGICNVIYFNEPLTTNKIYNLYNSVKSKTPPTTNESNTTILTYKV